MECKSYGMRSGGSGSIVSSDEIITVKINLDDHFEEFELEPGIFNKM